MSLNIVNDTFAVGATVLLTATLRDAAGNTLQDREIAWSTSDPARATVSPTGEVHSTALGGVTITAAAEGKSAAAILTLAPLITVSRPLPTTFAGDTTLLIAALTDADRNPVAGDVEEWTSSDAAVATVTGDGVVTGVSPGTATIRAAASGGSGSVDVVVLDPTPRANREIAYLRSFSIDELSRINPDGSGTTPVTEPGQYVPEFQWSPTGDRFAVAYFPSISGAKQGIYVINPDGSDERELVTGPSSHPRWSPDGQRLLLSAGSPARVYRVNADGTGLVPLLSQFGDQIAPEWSPDGRQIGFTHSHGGCEELWLMDPNSTGAHQVELPVGACSHTWSPDGKHIAFVAPADFVNDQGIWLMNSDGSDPHRITPDCSGGGCAEDRDYSRPRWSRDGRHLAFVSTVPTGTPILVHIYHLDTGETTELDVGDSLDPSVDWSPDGTKLAFSSRNPVTGFTQIVVSGIDGNGQVGITTEDEESYFPSWEP